MPPLYARDFGGSEVARFPKNTSKIRGAGFLRALPFYKVPGVGIDLEVEVLRAPVTASEANRRGADGQDRALATF
jgi:hypothetical protein